MTGDDLHDCERGAGTVLVLAVMAAALALTSLTGLLGQVIVARHRAQAAADLAALAGAAAAVSGKSVPNPFSASPADDGCRTAGAIASVNGAEIGSCVVSEEGVVAVGVSVPVGPRQWRAHAVARAGDLSQAGR
jgi:secretion/DNA translocation related TadE-like protein